MRCCGAGGHGEADAAEASGGATPRSAGFHALRQKGRVVDVSDRRVGAGDRDRTDDIQLGKLTFYH